MLSTPLHLAHLVTAARKVLDERASGKSKAKKELCIILVDQNAGKKGSKATMDGKKAS